MAKKYLQKVAFGMDVIIIILMISICLVTVFQKTNYLQVFWVDEMLKEEENYQVEIYAYYEASKEEKVPNFYETKVKKITSIPVESGSNLALTLKSLEYNCPVNKIICQNPSVLSDRLGGGIYYYNENVKNAIKKENQELEKYWLCFNQAKTKKQKNKCQFDYYFDEQVREEKFDINGNINENVMVLIMDWDQDEEVLKNEE